MSVRWTSIASLTAVAVLLLSCSSPTNNGNVMHSPIYGVWSSQAGDTTVTLILREWSFEFASQLTPAGAPADTLLAYGGTYSVDTTVTPHHLDLLVSHLRGGGNPMKALDGIYQTSGDTLSVAVPDSLGFAERPPDFVARDWDSVYRLVEQP